LFLEKEFYLNSLLIEVVRQYNSIKSKLNLIHFFLIDDVSRDYLVDNKSDIQLEDSFGINQFMSLNSLQPLNNQIKQDLNTNLNDENLYAMKEENFSDTEKNKLKKSSSFISTSSSSSSSLLLPSSHKSKLTSKHSNDTRDAQRCFNKFVKYHVKKRFGENILIENQVRDLDFGEMLEIRSTLKSIPI
jgi:hypothetical protein